MPYTLIESRADIEAYNATGRGFIDPDTELESHITVGRGVVVENDVQLGEGCFIGHHATIRPFTKMGHHSELRAYGWLANNVTIGHHTTIYQYGNICFGAILGNYIYFGCKSIMTNAHDVVLHRGREFTPDPPIVEDGARILTDVTFLPGVRIGMNSVVGAGSMVTKSIPPGEIWFGNPAKLQGYVDPDDKPEAWKR